jgi:hypothetical protein
MILTPAGFLLVTFLVFLGTNGVAVTLRLLARVLDDPALGTYGDVPTDSAHVVQVERGASTIGVSHSKLGIGAMKLSKVYKQVHEE